jgi:parvulin-like peptidyl-prolyl isomerase
VRLDALSPAIGGVLFALSPGQTTAYPVRVAPNAWFIVKVEARRQQGAPSFDSVRDRLAQQAMRASTPAAIQKAVAGLPAYDYGMTGKPPAPAH